MRQYAHELARSVERVTDVTCARKPQPYQVALRGIILEERDSHGQPKVTSTESRYSVRHFTAASSAGASPALARRSISSPMRGDVVETVGGPGSFHRMPDRSDRLEIRPVDRFSQPVDVAASVREKSRRELAQLGGNMHQARTHRFRKVTHVDDSRGGGRGQRGNLPGAITSRGENFRIIARKRHCAALRAALGAARHPAIRK